jgi:hypothetical protein
MTSAINFTAIDTSYPVAGIDNDSQGFRDNFTIISTALAVAKAELSALQTNAVLIADLGSGNTLTNDLLGSTISNGVYTNMSGAAKSTVGAGTGVTFISINDGPLQIFTIDVDEAALTFRDWPDSGLYSKVRLHLVGTGTTDKTPVLYTQGGAVSYATGFPGLLIASDKQLVLDAWTYNGGGNVFVQFIGEF